MPKPAGTFHAPWWGRNAHVQTIWGTLGRRAPRVAVARVRWELPDGDFLDVDELPAAPGAPRLLVLHGLESSSSAVGVRACLAQAARRGWGGWALNFRGCSGSPNRLARSYHGGDTGDVAWLLAQLRARHPQSPVFAIGFSLGGNVLLKYLGDQGAQAAQLLRAAAAISAPVDLALSVKALEQGFSRVYEQRLVAQLKRKTFLKLKRHPGMVDRGALQAVRSLAAFDDLVTAPVHGFADARTYWAASSAGPRLPAIRCPTLLINAEDDPFFSAAALPRAAVAANPHLTAVFPPHGGHLGFVQGAFWAPRGWAEQAAVAFLAGQA